MGLLYGAKAKLRLTLYEGTINLSRHCHCHSQGLDFFYHGEAVDRKGNMQYAPRLAYDAFLGQYLEMREKMEPGFRINTPPTSVIKVTPDPSVWGKQRYRNWGAEMQAEECRHMFRRRVGGKKFVLGPCRSPNNVFTYKRGACRYYRRVKIIIRLQRYRHTAQEGCRDRGVSIRYSRATDASLSILGSMRDPHRRWLAALSVCWSYEQPPCVDFSLS